DVAAMTAKAYNMTAAGRPGPVLVDFPKDIQMAPAPQEQESEAVEPAVNTAGQMTSSVMQAAIKRAASLIANAKRPVFYGGGGLVKSGPDAREVFANLVSDAGAPWTLTLMGLVAVPANDKQFVGVLGMHGTLEANLAMHHADLIVCI